MNSDIGLMGDAHSEKGEQTRQLLLEAAQSLFAEHAFRGTSIRDIARAAGTNVAAVNYHFGSKEKLYRAVFRQLAAHFDATKLQAVRDALDKSAGKPTVEGVLEAYALAWGQSAEQPDARRAEMLVAHELAEPVVGAEFLLEEFLEPLQQVLGEALQAACPEASTRALQLGIHSFLAQLGHMNRVQLHLNEFGAERVPMLDSEEAIRHIIRFTSAGLEALAKPESASQARGGGSS
jgi:AcrR family transcriptional regulator